MSIPQVTMQRLPAGVDMPTHHPNGQAIIGCVGLHIDAGRTRVYASRPTPPGRLLYEWSDAVGDDVYMRELTDEEFAEAQRAYASADAAWCKTGGITFTKGPVRISGRFICHDGAWAEGDYEGGSWFWRAWWGPTTQ